jgi:hypothetical protein
MLLIAPNCSLASAVAVDPGGGNPGVFLEVPATRMEFSAANSAYKWRFVPSGNSTQTFTVNGTTYVMSLNSSGLLNLAGTDLKFARGYSSLLKVSALDALQAASGTVTAAFTALFTGGSHVLKPGDSCLFSCGGDAGSPFSGSTQLALNIASPVNMLIEWLLLGKET